MSLKICYWMIVVMMAMSMKNTVAFRPPLLDGFAKVRPLGLIVSSRGIVSSLVENIHMEIFGYDNMLSWTNDMFIEFNESLVDQRVYISMVGLFVYYLWINMELNSLVEDNKRLARFSTFGMSRRITNQICLIFIFVFTKDVLYAS